MGAAPLLIALLLCGRPCSAYVHLMMGHPTPNMHVTVYSRFGRLLENATTGPGFHLVNRLTTSCDDVQVTPQVDRVSAGCVTRDGIALRFEGIEVNESKIENTHKTNGGRPPLTHLPPLPPPAAARR